MKKEHLVDMTELVAEASLDADIRAAAKLVGREQARFVVDQYMAIQQHRKAANQRISALSDNGSGATDVLDWLGRGASFIEAEIFKILKIYAMNDPMGRWALSVFGVGPVVAAGLLAHIDLEPWVCAHSEELFKKKKKACTPSDPCGPECQRQRIYTAGHIWAFAGLDPSKKWEKGKRRPHNATLKLICYYAGECFIKGHNNPNCFYGKVFESRKRYEWENNLSGKYADQARGVMDQKSFSKGTTAYNFYGGLISPTKVKELLDAGKSIPEGFKPCKPPVGDEVPMLPPGHINARARRHAVKLFLAHWFEEAYRQRYKEEPPIPYPIAHMGHAHYIAAPGQAGEIAA